jgi:molybdate transport system permease protein
VEQTLNIILLSCKVATIATAAILPVGVYLGWLFARKSFVGKTLLDGTVNIPLVMPPVVTGYILLIALGPASLAGQLLQRLFGIEIAFTWKAAVLASAIVSFPLLVRAVRVAVDSVDSRLENAARTLRAGEWQIFLKITLPLSAPGIIAGAVLAFARAFGEFGATVIFASNIPGQTQTIPLALFTYANQPGGEQKSMVLLAIAVLVSYISVIVNEWLLRRFKNAGS